MVDSIDQVAAGPHQERSPKKRKLEEWVVVNGKEDNKERNRRDKEKKERRKEKEERRRQKEERRREKEKDKGVMV